MRIKQELINMVQTCEVNDQNKNLREQQNRIPRAQGREVDTEDHDERSG